MTWTAPTEFWRVYEALRWPIHALWSLGVLGGLRVGECLALRWVDVDLDARTINVRESVEPFHGPRGEILAPDPRVVPMSEDLHRALCSWRDRSGWQGVAPVRVVPSLRSDGGYLDVRTARKELRRVLAYLGVSRRPFKANSDFYQRLLARGKTDGAPDEDDPYALAIQPAAEDRKPRIEPQTEKVT